MLTPKQAALICEAHEIERLFEEQEEIEMLEAQNPELLEAYKALQKLSVGGKAKTSKRRRQ